MKKPFKKRILPALALGAVMFTAVSCTGGNSSYQNFEGDPTKLTTTITWWNNYKTPKNDADYESNKSSFKEYDFQKNVIKKFNEIYPNITVNTEYKGSYNDIQKAVSGGLSTGTVPNIASCYGDHVAAYQAAGATLVMDDPMKDPTIGLSKEDNSDYNQTYFNAEKNMYGEKQFLSLPYSKSAETLGINATVFEKDGAGKCGEDTFKDKNGVKTPVYVAPEAAASKKPYEIPKTYKDVIATARKMKTDFPSVFGNQKNADGYFEAVPFCYDSAENMFISFLEMAEIPYTDATGKSIDKQVLFNNDDAKEMMINLKKWNNEGLIATQDQLPITDKAKGYHAYSSDMVKEGKIFMSITSTAGARYFALDGGFKAKLVETPTFTKECYDNATGTATTDNHKVISQGPSLTFFRKDDANQNYGSWLFYKFLTNTKNSATLAKMTSYFPLRESSYETKEVKDLVTAAETEAQAGDTYSKKSSIYTGTSLKLNQTYTKNNDYFVSDVFSLSSSTRTAVGDLVETVFNNKTAKTDEEIEKLVDDAFTSAYKTAIGA